MGDQVLRGHAHGGRAKRAEAAVRHAAASLARQREHGVARGDEQVVDAVLVRVRGEDRDGRKREHGHGGHRLERPVGHARRAIAAMETDHMRRLGAQENVEDAVARDVVERNGPRAALGGDRGRRGERAVPHAARALSEEESQRVVPAAQEQHVLNRVRVFDRGRRTHDESAFGTSKLVNTGYGVDRRRKVYRARR